MTEGTGTFEVESEGDGELVTLRLDRPGISAVSHTIDAAAAIRKIADAAGLTVSIQAPPELESGDETE
jgi:hypothetical protein